MSPWLILLVAACAADVATTASNLRAGGRELNTLLPAALIAKIGFWPAALILKAVLIGIAALVDVKEFYIALAAINFAAAAYNFTQRKKSP